VPGSLSGDGPRSRFVSPPHPNLLTKDFFRDDYVANSEPARSLSTIRRLDANSKGTENEGRILGANQGKGFQYLLLPDVPADSISFEKAGEARERVAINQHAGEN